MPEPPTPEPPARDTPAAAVLLAIVAAASAFLLPALDADLPGGSISWQVGAVALAIALALWIRRRASAARGVTRERLARWVATAALLLALVWLGGVGLLWLIWPR
ncbi:MAG TPA: hypothetical protein VFS05_15975 [Gemmatimonadaceae bacterium]|nr:hypothetical protein [Gemmatimonadaceae bacterium]